METVQKLKFSLFAHISFTKWSSYVCKTIQHFRQPWIVKNILRWGVSIYIITVKIHCLEMLVQKHTDLDSLNNQSVCRFGAHSDFLARYTIKMRKWIKKTTTLFWLLEAWKNTVRMNASSRQQTLIKQTHLQWFILYSVSHVLSV